MSSSESKTNPSTSTLEMETEEMPKAKPETLIWYRHSGEDEVDGLPYEPQFRKVNEQQVLADLGNHDITHMYIRSGDVSLLYNIAPNLTHLKMEGFTGTPAFEKLSSLKELQVLDLALNDFSEGLPLSVCQLSSLRELKLRCCELTELPDQLGSLSGLQALDVSGNNFSKGLPQAIGQLTMLEALYLSDSRLTGLPTQLAALSRLRVLDLSANNFSHGFPDAVFQLISLEKLRMTNCQISQFPEELSSLSRLKNLHISRNNFDAGFPSVICYLSSLEVLSLVNCNATDLPVRLTALSQLKELDLSGNKFADGLPLVVTRMVSLNKLSLRDCDLINLPAEFQRLVHLRELNLSRNVFTIVPPCVYRLHKLQTLDISYNKWLKRIESEVLQVKQLTTLICFGCSSLKWPPYAVSIQGVSAARKYLADLARSKVTTWSTPTIVVIGMSLAGKTSLILSLQAGQRMFTYRAIRSRRDEATGMFKVEELHFPEFTVKIFDYGGQEVYNVAYRLAEKDHCLPIAVVNMKQFDEMAEVLGPKTATRRLLFNWLSHMYVSSPKLGAPIIALTHTDKLSHSVLYSRKQELLQAAESIKTEVLEVERRLSTQGLQHADHFKSLDRPLVHPDDVFEFGADEQDTANILCLTKCLERRCMSFLNEIPEQWGDIAKYLAGNHQFCVSTAMIQEKFQMNDALAVVLRYLHNCGSVLWFESSPQLSGYVFHNIQAVVDMISLLFHHSSAETWINSVENFSPAFHNGEVIERERYVMMIKDFAENGILARVLLVLLLEKHQFPVELSLELLQSFFILYGPLLNTLSEYYIVPNFATTAVPVGWQTDGLLQLRFDLLFKGLSPPKYVFQQITMAVINCTSRPFATVTVRVNGATIRSGECAIHLVHDYLADKVALQFSTSLEELGSSWKTLLETVAYIVNMLQVSWPASRVETLVYCAHCLFSRHASPSFVAHPSWLYSRGTIDFSRIQTFPNVQLVACKNDPTGDEHPVPSIPSPLVYPCYEISSSDLARIAQYLATLEPRTLTQYEGDEKRGQEVKERDASGMSDQSESDISDFEDDETSDEDDADVHVAMDLKPVTKYSIKQLYNNPSQVYTMSGPVRGRAVILCIGGSKFKDAQPRLDSNSLAGLFSELAFQTDVRRNLTLKNIPAALKQETSNFHHHKYGMFVMVILGHSEVEGNLYDEDGQILAWSVIFDQLSAGKFPAMAGKPKLILSQSYSAVDLMPSMPLLAGSASMHVPPSDVCLFSVNKEPAVVSNRSQSSLFVRVLEATFYKHSCHRDVTDLIKIVQNRFQWAAMQTRSHALANKAVPQFVSTYQKRVFLFPGLNTKAYKPVIHLQQVSGEDSDLSDSIDYLDEENEALDFISLRPNPVTRPDIKQLFTSATVYRMSVPVRGRCLVINNGQFKAPSALDQVKLADRPGSDMDVKNIKGVFNALSFDVHVHINLSGEDMLRVIKEEVRHPRHHSYGMFVLVVMTHGNETQMAGSDAVFINTSTVYDLVSPGHFKAMAGKPKWLIMTGCSQKFKDVSSAGMDSLPSTSKQTDAQQLHEPGHASTSPKIRLATDDFFIMRGFASYLSSRSGRNGCWFIRALVEALYKHSNHRDVQTLFDQQVKKKVRDMSISYQEKHGQVGGQIGGQEAIMECFPTAGRKLHLFPGFDPHVM